MSADHTKPVGHYQENLIVCCELQKMRNLVAADLNGKSDPYCVIKFGEHTWKSMIKKKTLDPEWDVLDPVSPIFSFKVPSGRNLKLEFTVFDHDMIGKDDFLGGLILDLSLWPINTSQDRWWKLENIKSGEIKVKVSVETPAYIRSLIGK